MWGHRKRKKSKLNSGWQSNVTSETVVPTETRLHRNFTQTCLHYRAQDDSQMRRGGLCVYNIDVWYSHTVKADGQCFPDIKLLKCLCLFLCILIAVYMFCNLCSMKESTLCCVMTNKLPCFLSPVVCPGYCFSLATLTWNLFLWWLHLQPTYGVCVTGKTRWWAFVLGILSPVLGHSTHWVCVVWVS